jgi:hypothetical protein
MVPSSVSNRKRAGPELAPSETTKPAVEFVTIPVGKLTGAMGWLESGIVTTNGGVGTGVPEWSYKVATPVKLSATQKGLVGKKARPHPFTRLGSLFGVDGELVETKLNCKYWARAVP